jgi:hypothetical protein
MHCCRNLEGEINCRWVIQNINLFEDLCKILCVQKNLKPKILIHSSNCIEAPKELYLAQRVAYKSKNC